MIFAILLLAAAQEAPGSETLPFPAPWHVRLPRNFEFIEDSTVMLGLSLAVADVNGDGIGDLVAGAPELGPSSDYGAAVLFDGATFEVFAILNNPKPRYDDRFGLAVGAADFTGDGRAEIVVASQDDSLLYDGASLQPIRVVETADVIALGDCNADGALDLVLAARLGNHSGKVRFGPDLNASATLPVLPGTGGGNRAAVGDLDGDGAADVLLADIDAASSAGRCWFTLGPGFATTTEIKDPEPTPVAYFGKTVAIADFDADGWNDVLVTSERTPCEYYDLCRDTLAYFGPDFTSFRQVTDRRDSWRWGLGSLATAGDVNHDGIADVVAAAAVPFEYQFGYMYLPELFVYLGPDLHQVVRFWPADRDYRDVGGGGGAFVWSDHDGDGRQEFFMGHATSRSLRGKRPGWILTQSGVVHVFDFSTADPISSFASGSKGSGGFEPRLSATGPARAGSVLELTIERALGGATGLLLIGFERTGIPVCPPASFLLQNSYRRVVAEQAVPIALAGTPGVPGAGTLRLRVSIPSDSVATWQGIYYQAILDDPQAPCGQAATNGVQVFVQP